MFNSSLLLNSIAPHKFSCNLILQRGDFFFVCVYVCMCYGFSFYYLGAYKQKVKLIFSFISIANSSTELVPMAPNVSSNMRVIANPSRRNARNITNPSLHTLNYSVSIHHHQFTPASEPTKIRHELDHMVVVLAVFHHFTNFLRNHHLKIV